jgi:hypothetical protein
VNNQFQFGLNMKKLLTLGAVFVLAAGIATAQTNSPGAIFSPGKTNSPPQYNPLPSSTAADIAKVFQDFGVNVSVSGVAQFLILTFFGARYLRKGLPDRIQTGVIGTILKHAALEINPQNTPTPPQALPVSTNPGAALTGK